MKKVNINKLVIKEKYNTLIEILPNNIIIVGKIENIRIDFIYDELDLSHVECYKINYSNQIDDSIKYHILPNSLKVLTCYHNDVTSLPELPNSLESILCYHNRLTKFPKVPSTIKDINCSGNMIKSFYYNSLKNTLLEDLNCFGNQLTKLPTLPNTLKFLECSENQLEYIGKLPENLEISIHQDKPLEYFEYNPTLISDTTMDIKFIVDGYNKNKPITNQDELDKYMEWLKRNTIKSSRK